jgi:hypothetical protein
MVEGLPVPEQAVLAGQGKNGGASGAKYEVASSIGTLDDWYNGHLARGQAWRNWTWSSPSNSACPNLNFFHSSGESWQWQSGGSALSLTTASSGSGTSQIEINVLLTANGSLCP